MTTKSDKRLTDKKKQFVVLPNEVDPTVSRGKAYFAVQKTLNEIVNTRSVRR